MATGDLKEFLEKPQFQQSLEAALVQKARMKEIEALAKSLAGGK